MYVKPGCPYCEAAREDYRSRGLEWEERDATTEAAWREELYRHSKDTGLVPTILEGGEVVTVGWKGGG